MIAITIDKS